MVGRARRAYVVGDMASEYLRKSKMFHYTYVSHLFFCSNCLTYKLFDDFIRILQLSSGTFRFPQVPSRSFWFLKVPSESFLSSLCNLRWYCNSTCSTFDHDCKCTFALSLIQSQNLDFEIGMKYACFFFLITLKYKTIFALQE